MTVTQFAKGTRPHQRVLGITGDLFYTLLAAVSPSAHVLDSADSETDNFT